MEQKFKGNFVRNTQPHPPTALLKLGESYKAKGDIKQAFHWYKLAADSGLAEAQTIVGDCYHFGEGTDKSYKEAFKYYQLAADQGLARAQNNVGSCYHFGKGTDKSYKEAFKYYQLAADKGISQAQNLLGDCFREGRGVSQNSKEAFKYYQLSANQGFSIAQTNLAACYQEGKGTTKDLKKAREYYQLAADQGGAQAQLVLGSYYADGIGGSKDLEKAFYYYQLAAEQKLAEAQNRLGFCYKNGIGTSPDYVLAITWLQRAANQKSPAAQFNLANCYADGVGVPMDLAKALHWYQLAADQNYREAQNNLGIHYLKGLGVDKDLEKAVHYFTLAAQQGDAEAQSNLAECYLRGTGVESNLDKGLHWYQLAADQGFSPAQACLETCLQIIKNNASLVPNIAPSHTAVNKEPEQSSVIENSSIGYNENPDKLIPEKRFEQYKLAADQGNSEAQNALGDCFRNGDGVSKNYQEAFKYYWLSANQHFKLAQINLADCYRKGIGTEKDLNKAREYYQLSADQGIISAQLSLANYYKNGIGGPKNLAEAFKYYQLAAKQGDPLAQLNLADYYANGWGVKINLKEAIRLLQLAAKQNCRGAQNTLGLYYLNGFGIGKDVKKAVHYFTLAAQQGFVEAQTNLAGCYFRGEGVEKNSKEAIRLLQLAAEQNDIETQNTLGLHYLKGLGVDKDVKKAVHYFTLAAQQGFAEAQTNLATCYFRAEGVEKNLKQAIHWYQLAVTQGFTGAQSWLETCVKQEKFEEIQEFFQRLQKNGFPFIADINSIDISYSLNIYFKDLSHPNYQTLIKEIKKLPGFDIKGTSPKSVTLCTSKIKQEDFKVIKSIFLLAQKEEGEKQPTHNPPTNKRPIEQRVPEFFQTEQSSSSYPSVKQQNPPSGSRNKKNNAKKTHEFSNSNQNKPSKNSRNSNLRKQQSKAQRKGKKFVPIVKVNETDSIKKNVLSAAPVVSRELPSLPKISRDELKLVQQKLEQKDANSELLNLSVEPMLRSQDNAEISQTAHNNNPANLESLSHESTLRFHYYQADLLGQKVIELVIFPNENEPYLNELMNLCEKLQRLQELWEQPDTIQDSDHTQMIEQAFLYDFFFLLELAQKTFDSVKNINDMIPLPAIKSLRQLIISIFKQEKIANLANLKKEAEKICQQLQYLNDAWRDQDHQEVARKIEQLKLMPENLLIQEEHVNYSPNFFKHTAKQDAADQFSKLCACVKSFSQYMKIVEDDSKTVTEKTIAFDAAKACILWLNGKKNIFEEKIGKSEILSNIYFSFRVERNQLSHPEEEQGSPEWRNFIWDEKALRGIKPSMLLLQELVSKALDSKIPVTDYRRTRNTL